MKKWIIAALVMLPFLGAIAQEVQLPPMNEMLQGFEMYVCDSEKAATLIAEVHRDQGHEEAIMMSQILAQMDSSFEPGQPECGVVRPAFVVFTGQMATVAVPGGTSIVYELMVPGYKDEDRRWYAPFFFQGLVLN